MGRRYDTVSFLSDLGTKDEFVGVVKAVIRDIAPHVVVIDLTHGIAPFDIRAGSLALARCIAYVPDGVVMATVDPGVGSSRRAVAIEVAGGDGVIIGPDNGVLAPAVALAGGAGRSVVLDLSDLHLPAPGATFAARDVFAPVAGHLCNGVDLYEVGTPIDPDLLVPGVVPLPREDAGSLLCEVLWVDRFGNCQLNVGPDEVEQWGGHMSITVHSPDAPVRRTATMATHFDGVRTGAIGLIVDGAGLLTLALARRSAAEELGIAAGEMVILGAVDGGEVLGVTSPVTLRPTR